MTELFAPSIAQGMSPKRKEKAWIRRALSITILEGGTRAFVLQDDGRNANSCTNDGEQTRHPPLSASGETVSELLFPVVTSPVTERQPA